MNTLTLASAFLTVIATQSVVAGDPTFRVIHSVALRHEKLGIVANARFIDDHRVVALTDLYSIGAPGAPADAGSDVEGRVTLFDFRTGDASDFIHGVTYPVSFQVYARQGADGNRYVIVRDGPSTVKLLKADADGALMTQQALPRAPRDYYVDAEGIMHYADDPSKPDNLPLASSAVGVTPPADRLAAQDESGRLLMPTSTDIIRLNAEHQVSDVVHINSALPGSVTRSVSLMPNGHWLSAEIAADQAGGPVMDVVIYNSDGTLWRQGILDAIKRQLAGQDLGDENILGSAHRLRPIAVNGNRVAIIVYGCPVPYGLIVAIDE